MKESPLLINGWKNYEPIIHTIIELFNPFVEITIHDLEKEKIIAIYNNITQRKIGDPSSIKEVKKNSKEFPDAVKPFYKQNWDGRSLKSACITLRDPAGVPVGLMCINVDISNGEEWFRLMGTFLNRQEGNNLGDDFSNQFENQVNTLFQQYLDEKSLSTNHLSREHRKGLIQHLYRKGIFNFKNAAPYLSKRLKTSRATIYNYIKQM